MLLLSSNIAPQPASQQRPRWPLILGAGCLLIALLAAWGIYRTVKSVQSVTSGENRELIDAMVMMSLADENVIRSSATDVDTADLAANPAGYSGKWLAVSGTVAWLQNKAGSPAAPGSIQADETFLYWLDGPLIVHDTADVAPLGGQGTAIKAFGRCIEVPIAKVGLSSSGHQALADMHAANAETVAYFLAKWVESP
jgi:hypothetical protein